MAHATDLRETIHFPSAHRLHLWGSATLRGCGPTEAGANHIGGMSSGGLGKTDLVGDSGKLIGGIAAEFYSSNARHYNTTAPPSYDHEPHVAQSTFDELLANSTVSVIRGGHGANIVSAQKHGDVNVNYEVERTKGRTKQTREKDREKKITKETTTQISKQKHITSNKITKRAG